MTFADRAMDRFGRWLAEILEAETSGYEPFTPSDTITMRRVLQPGDIVLVEGNQKVSVAIKYLTQSTWSHAALYIGDALKSHSKDGEPLTLIESNLGEGCVAVPLSKYQTYNTRICRPVGLTVADRKKVVDYMIASIGTKYDTRHILDLARYLLPTPPVPVRWRRRMIALGSSDPTRAICSSLIAQAYQNVRYPILPVIKPIEHHEHVASPFSRREILHIRHHSLYTPRDFDLSPYFTVVKPTLESGFNYKSLNWSDMVEDNDWSEAAEKLPKRSESDQALTG